jgi:hypothetical protein
MNLKEIGERGLDHVFQHKDHWCAAFYHGNKLSCYSITNSESRD